MSKFTDIIEIRIKAGNGGPGCISFHREKSIAKGGPNGGDGGKGGNVFLVGDRRLYNLSHLYKDRVYKAENGHPGMGNNRYGSDGADFTVRVPLGTQISEKGMVLTDFIEDKSSFVIAKGGIGGKGNTYYKSSTNQTPRKAQKGMPGEEKSVTLNLKLIADVGLVGLPNSGKSTLLSKITHARPKIAEYPFTTLVPNLGVMERENGLIVKIADIPGIIEGAHLGHGLGLSFLQHIERVRMILFLIDAASDDPEYTLKLLRSELQCYSDELLGKPFYILLTKSDLADSNLIEERITRLGPDPVLPISSIDGTNLDALGKIIEHILEGSDAA